MNATIVVNMELDIDKYCKVGQSPINDQKKGKSRSIKGRNNSSINDDYDFISLEKEGFTEIKFRDYRSLSCKNIPTHRKSGRLETRGGRQKVEVSFGSEEPFSFSILDSICGLDEEPEIEPVKVGSPVLSMDPNSLYMGLKERKSDWGLFDERDSMENDKFKCEQVKGPSNNVNVERDSLALNNSLSSKLGIPHSPTHSEGDIIKGSSKNRLINMFDPFTKSKSHQTPSNDAKSSRLVGIEKSKTLRKSLFHEFSSVVPNAESGPPPAHLRGNLKMEQKHGIPYFEFTTTHSEDLLVAKTWKAENTLNWVYTFHSIKGKKRHNATSWGIKYSNKDSPMVGQMQVTCCLCSEIKGGGALSNSMTTEFVLYDIAHASKSVTNEENNKTKNSKVLGVLNENSIEGNIELDHSFGVSNPIPPYPWGPSDLKPSFEIASIVVEAPFEKRESLKYKRGDKLSDRVTLDVCDDRNMVKVNVVTPLGNHGLPNGDESRGASSLLDRWRLGGGCDCGGWDMGCPIVVFGNPRIQCMDERSLLGKDRPLKLYVQGRKVNTPSLTITITEKGKYTVDFHAQLSTLQAFAICVAIMHTTEASSLVDQQKNKDLLQCSSLKVLVEDEVKFLIEAVNDEENKKVSKIVEGHQPSFLLNPPFSPIARV